MTGFVMCGKPQFSGGCKQVKLVDVCEILDSKRIPITKNKRIAGPYPYYGANGIQDHVADFLFDDELVLLAEDGGHFEKDGQIAYRVSGKCWVNNHAHVLKAKDDVDIDYLCYALQSFDVSSLVNGATRKKLTQSAMKKITLPLRSVDAQLAIVNSLKTVEIQLADALKLLSSLDDLVKSRFIEMFGGIEPTVPLSSICEVFTDGDWIESKDQSADGIRLIQTGNIGTGAFRNKGDRSRFVSEETFDRLQCKEIIPGDILISRLPDPVGRACVLPSGLGRCITAVDCTILRLKPDWSASFVVWFSQTEEYGNQIATSLTGATRKRISRSNLGKIKVPNADSALQSEFDGFVSNVDKLRFILLGNPLPMFGHRSFCCSTNSGNGGVILEAKDY